MEQKPDAQGGFPPSITEVPVTPGIDIQTYESANDDTPTGLPDTEYFSKKDVDHALVASPKPVDKDQPAEVQIEAGADAGKDFLNRLRRTAMGSRQDSLSDIRAKYPSLSLSGNIISATFTIPHELRYRKGADWVSNRASTFPVP